MLRVRMKGVGLFVLSVSLLAGCSGTDDGPTLVEAGGSVTYKGGPLAGATVTFVPEDGPVAIGVTDLEGKFTLSSGAIPGIVAGPCKVSVTALQGGGGGNEVADPNVNVKPKNPEEMKQRQQKMVDMMKKGAPSDDAKSLIPEKYGIAESSGLTFTVKEGDPNQFKIELTD